MAFILLRIISILFNVLFIIIIADVILSYFMSPWHPVKRFLDRIVQPMLAPIRKVVPPLAMIDFSPLILLILLQVVEYLLRMLVFAIF